MSEPTNNEGQHRFEIASDGEIGFLTYRIEHGVLVLVHTEVPKPISGRGIAAALARGAFDHARSHQMQVKVICPYIAAWLERHPKEEDIVRNKVAKR